MKALLIKNQIKSYQKRLNKANSVTVWVCSKDSSSYEPRILGIDTDQIVLLSKSETFKNAQKNVITSIIISIGFILLPFVMNQFFKCFKTFIKLFLYWRISSVSHSFQANLQLLLDFNLSVVQLLFYNQLIGIEEVSNVI